MGNITVVRFSLLWLLWLLPSLALAHQGADTGSHWLPDHAGSAGRWVVSAKEIHTTFPSQTSPVLSRTATPVRVGMLWDGPASVRWEVRFWSQDRGWSNWQAFKRVHSEGLLHVSHKDTPAVTTHLQLRYHGSGHPTHIALSWLTKLGEPGATSQTRAPDSSRQSAGSYGTTVQALTAPFQPRSAWKAKAAKCSTSNPTKKYIAVHHTAGPNNDKSAPDARMRQIQSFHQVTRGWCDIAYHILISQDGRMWEGRPATVLGSHVGRANSNNLGICFFGTFTSITPSTKMLCAGATLMDWGIKKFGISRSRSVIRGHREHPGQSTSCPGNGILNQMNKMVQSTSNFCTTSKPKLDAKFAGQGAKGVYGGQNGQYYSLCPGQSFQFTFSVTNTGTLTWIDNGKTTAGQSVRLGFKSGERFGAPTRISVNNASLKTVKPGQKVTFTISGKAPNKTGKFKTEWQMISEGVQWFGPTMYLTFNISTLPTGSGKSCNSGQKGVCATGKMQCQSGKLACVATVKPSTEVCDSKDNDCDGQTDETCDCKPGETQPCYSGPKGTQGKGACKSGRQACVNGKWGTCNGQSLPGKEVCDGKDNDCDGAVDNGNPGAGQFCNPSVSGGTCKEGQTACRAGRLVCIPAAACQDREPVVTPDRRENNTPDAGGNDRIVIPTDKPSKPDNRPKPDTKSNDKTVQEVIVLGGTPCTTKKDCRNGQDCLSGTCKAVPAASGGCSCSTQAPLTTPAFWLLGLLFLLGWRRRS
jgi:MYXO-CTERM domain-containing protein